MGHTRQKGKYILYTVIILLCLVMTSLWLLSNMYARYTTGTTSEDGARVAKFNVTQGDSELKQQIELKMSPGEEKIYTIQVINHSEVAIAYKIEADTPYKNLPIKVTMEENNSAITQGEISANDTTVHTYAVKISWPKSDQDAEYAGKADLLKLTLKAEQID